jgi:predicted ribosome quality control (RQC) complex YloA/Tae2 family protein
MYFDALTLAAVADDLRATILHGRVQRVLLPTSLSIGLEIYAQRRRFHLLASAHPQFARVHLVQRRLSRGVEQASPLLLLLRKYVRGGQIVAIEQPPLERLLLLSIVKEPASRNLSADAEAAPEEDAAEPADTEPEPRETLRCELIIEPMERRSNIMLVDESNVILDSVKRVTPRMSQRVVLPRQPYETPPPQQKRDPRTAAASGIAALHDEKQRDLARALVGAYKGISPQAAREVVFRALGQPSISLDESEALPTEAIAASLRELFGAPWAPCLVPGTAEQLEPRAYAPYAITHLPGAEPQPGISQALEAFYAAREGVTHHQQHREAVRQKLEPIYERLAHQLAQIEGELARTPDIERLRWEGEMIFAFLHGITPGQTTLDVDGETITLDPAHSPVEEAQQRFRAYHKAQSGRESLEQRQRETRARLDGLAQLLALLGVADEREQIDQIAQEAAEQGYLPPPRQQRKQRRPPRRKPLHLVSSDGIDLYVGRSATQNEEVTFRIGRPDDWWLHVRTIAGAHVIVRSSKGGDIPEQTLQEAAGLAAYFSPLRHEGAADVELSRRRRVRKVPGGTPGLVTYQAERTLRVAPLPPWGS